MAPGARTALARLFCEASQGVRVPRIAANPKKVASLSPYSVRKMIGKLAPFSELVSVGQKFYLLLLRTHL
jgi:hypothetical protein